MALQRLSIDGIEIDATLTEKHSAQVTLTKHPVEQGASPADHAIELPERISLDCLLSNLALADVDRQSRGVTADPNSSTGAPGASGFAQLQYAKLSALKSSRRAVSVVTSLKTYENMVMTSLDTPVDAKTGDAIRFTCTFEQITFVSLGRVRLPPTPKDIKKPTKKNDQGKKTAEPAYYSSAAKNAFNGKFGIKKGDGIQ